ncbi:MAG: hypothetical protein U0802_22810 [Candidatus Binatia bacterium]
MSVAVLAATGLLMRRAERAAPAVAAHLGLALAGAGILTALYHQVYDLLLLAPTAVSVVLGLPAAMWAARTRWRVALASALLVVFGNYAATNTALMRIGLDGPWWLVVVSVNGVLLVAVWLAYGGLTLQLGRGAETAPADRRRVWTRRRVEVAP